MIASLIVTAIILLFGLLAYFHGSENEDRCGSWALFLSFLLPIVGLAMYLSTSDNLVKVPIVNRRLYLVYALMGIILWVICGFG